MIAKNTIVTFLLSIIFMSFCLVGSVGCKSEEKIRYKAELLILVSSENGESFSVTLSGDTPSFEKNMGTLPLQCSYKALLNIMTYHENNEKGALAYSFPFKYGYECEIDGAAVSYTIKNGDEESRSGFSMTDFNITSYNLFEGRVNLNRSAGVHTIRYSIPALKEYGTDAAEYIVKLNFDEDTRTKTAKITMQSTYKEFYSAEETKSYDFYVIEQIPNFDFVSLETSESIWGDRNVNISYRKMNENTGKVFPAYIQTGLQSDDILIHPNSKGLYLCRVAMNNHQEYRDVEYWCYLLFI